MLLDHPTITATDSQSEPDRVGRPGPIHAHALALRDGHGAGGAAVVHAS